MENCLSCLLINGTELKLIVSYFIMFSLERNTDFQELILYLFEDLLYFLWDFSIVMVRKLLALCTYPSEKASSDKSKILPLEIGLLWNNEELLLEAKSQEHIFVRDSKGSEHLRSWFLHDCLRFTEDSHIIQSITWVSEQKWRDIGNFTFPSNEYFRWMVPYVVSSSSMSLP